ncbi:ribonuclease Oy [Diabrotica virgifera virgifera]|uniref:Ribonuclease Oy n=1 Tax=Diabrotica virgifera virgifera TaxID=50390 RepID=A0A6P7F916_DIAVI|nr:ribonuclease Oy [Diabrotica virgifera virgifera]
MQLNFQILLLSLVVYSENVRAAQLPQLNGVSPTPYHDWDFLMFSQRWPITSCAEWEDKKSGNTCVFPPDRTQWIVHGMWPTKNGTEGPLFCPSAIHFDPDLLDPMLDALKAQWTNVEANTKVYSFWKHEWDKHGTCSVDLPALNSIPSFFSKGLELNKQLNIADMLLQSKITPGTTGYTVDEIVDAIKAVTQHQPNIECIVESHTKQSMISEIRICLDKSFEVIDCVGSALTNCNKKKPIMYLDNVPDDAMSQIDYIDEYSEERYRESAYYMEFYKFVKFLIWFSM